MAAFLDSRSKRRDGFDVSISEAHKVGEGDGVVGAGAREFVDVHVSGGEDELGDIDTE